MSSSASFVPPTKSQAIQAYGGNASALARALGITPQAVYQWPDGPIQRCYALELCFVLDPPFPAALDQLESEDTPTAPAPTN